MVRQQIDEMTQHQEHERPTPWEVEDAPTTYIDAQLKGIIGLEIIVQRSEGKWKVSQNRPEPDRQGVHEGLREKGQSAEDMAALVAKYGKLEG